MKVESKVILIFERDSHTRQSCLGILAAGGYTVLEADNSMEALLFAAEREGAVDLLLTGSNLPGSAGGELPLAFSMLWPDTDVLYLAEPSAQNHTQDLAHAVPRTAMTPESLLNAVQQLLETAVPA